MEPNEFNGMPKMMRERVFAMCVRKSQIVISIEHSSTFSSTIRFAQYRECFIFQPSPKMNNQKKHTLNKTKQSFFFFWCAVCGSLEHTLKRIVLVYVNLRNVSATLHSIFRIHNISKKNSFDKEHKNEPLLWKSKEIVDHRISTARQQFVILSTFSSCSSFVRMYLMITF